MGTKDPRGNSRRRRSKKDEVMVDLLYDVEARLIMKILLGYSVFVIAAIGFMVYADADPETPWPCFAEAKQVMVGTERMEVISYKCKFGAANQQGLDELEVKTLVDIYNSKQDGTYERPPIDTSTGITDFDNPLCVIDHIDQRTKEQYGCY